MRIQTSKLWSLNSRSACLVLVTLLSGLLKASPSLSQSESIIATHAGVSAANGAFANTQYIERPSSVVSDGSGGFYFAVSQNWSEYSSTPFGGVRGFTG